MSGDNTIGRLNRSQALRPERFALHSERLGPLPLVNHFLERIGLHGAARALRAHHRPAQRRHPRPGAGRAAALDPRRARADLPPAGDRPRLRRRACSASTPRRCERLSDDRIGRALDRLFDADRARAAHRGRGRRRRSASACAFDRLHNDSTSIALLRPVPRRQRPRRCAARTAPAITYGFARTTVRISSSCCSSSPSTADGGVPASFRCADGNTSDSRHPHRDLGRAARGGRPRRLPVRRRLQAVLATRTWTTSHAAGGRFVTVMPRSRQEDAQFRKWIQTHTPGLGAGLGPAQCPRTPTARGTAGTSTARVALDGGLAHHLGVEHAADAAPARRGASAGWPPPPRQLEQLHRRLAGARAAAARRRRDRPARRSRSSSSYHVGRYLKVSASCARSTASSRRGAAAPAPTPPTARSPAGASTSSGRIDEDAIAYDRKSDGMYPLLTNDRNLTAAQVLEAHKGQPTHREALRAGQDRARDRPGVPEERGPHRGALHPVLPGAARAGAHRARATSGACSARPSTSLPLYPEQRQCRRPTTEQVLRLFSLAQRHRLFQARAQTVQVFDADLTDLQRQVLALLGVPDTRLPRPRLIPSAPSPQEIRSKCVRRCAECKTAARRSAS